MLRKFLLLKTVAEKLDAALLGLHSWPPEAVGSKEIQLQRDRLNQGFMRYLKLQRHVRRDEREITQSEVLDTAATLRSTCEQLNALSTHHRDAEAAEEEKHVLLSRDQKLESLKKIFIYHVEKLRHHNYPDLDIFFHRFSGNVDEWYDDALGYMQQKLREKEPAVKRLGSERNREEHAAENVCPNSPPKPKRQRTSKGLRRVESQGALQFQAPKIAFQEGGAQLALPRNPPSIPEDEDADSSQEMPFDQGPSLGA
jgi:hypothetical protein